MEVRITEATRLTEDRPPMVVAHTIPINSHRAILLTLAPRTSPEAAPITRTRSSSSSSQEEVATPETPIASHPATDIPPVAAIVSSVLAVHTGDRR